jgi:hypothetical protein
VFRRRLAAEVKAQHGANTVAVITSLNPIVRGLAAYYRSVRSRRQARRRRAFGLLMRIGASAAEHYVSR